MSINLFESAGGASGRSAHPPGPAGAVAVVTTAERPTEAAHEAATHTEIARRLARLREPQLPPNAVTPARTRRYVLPIDTLVGPDIARAHGIEGEDDFFGGLVPHAFVATKAIFHPLVAPDAARPEGWSDAFAARVGKATLTGFTAFSLKDAERAGRALLPLGRVRVKCVTGRGGSGQSVVHDEATLDAALAAAAGEIACGIVLEEHLSDVVTYSVGEVRVGPHRAAYYGTQRLTTNNRGGEAYGGSDLFVVRGSLAALARSEVPVEARLAIEQALAADAAAADCFPGLIASRRNYDVAQGRNDRGMVASGVLEQSWRVGGASPAEILALEAFHASPGLGAIHASSHEVYGAGATAPEGATLFYQGKEAETGPLLKYAITRMP